MSQLLIIVQADQQAQANALATAMGPGGPGTFEIPLYPVDQDPQTTPSHYWCSVKLSPEQVQAVYASAPNFPGIHIVEWSPRQEPAKPREVLSQLGLVTFTPTTP